MKVRTLHLTTCLICLAPFIPCDGMVAVGSASIVAFNNEPAFLAAAPIVSTETFDEFPSRTALGAGVVEIDNVFYTAGLGGMWFAALFFGPPPSPPNALLSSAIEQKTLTFGDGFGTQAVGFFLQGGDASTRIALITATGEELTDTPSLDQGRVTAYRGYVSSDPIVSVRVFNTPDPRFGTNFQFDNVSRGVIVALPELPTGLLVAFGILAPISGCLRRISSSSAQ